MISLLLILSLLLAMLFAMNMGCSGTAPAFASVYGSSILSHKKIALLFGIFVIIGAMALGSRVVKTISKGIIPKEMITAEVALIILLAACISLIIANILRVPQSTSQVTVLAVVGIGIFYWNLNAQTFMIMIPMWLILPSMSFIFAYLLGKYAYKWLSVKLKNRKILLRYFVVSSCCYVAFSIGANNVANALAPLVGAGMIENMLGILLLAPLFGIGSFILGERVLKTTGKEITELDLISASLVCIVTGSLLIFASTIGIPQSLVQLNTIAIIGIGFVTNGRKGVDKRTVGKIVIVWFIAPIIALFISITLIASLQCFF